MRREILSKIMRLAWQFVKRNGYTMAEALRTAWLNIKLKAKMAQGIAKFYYSKVDGTMREAYGTLNPSLMPEQRAQSASPTLPYRPTTTPRNANIGALRWLTL